MKNKFLKSKIILFAMLLFLASQITAQNKSRILRNNEKPTKKNSNNHLDKLHNKFNVTDEMLRLQNINTTEVVDSVVGIDIFGTKFKAIYEYGAYGDIIMDLRQKWDGTKLINSTRTRTTYNSNGDQTERLSEIWGESDWIVNRRLSYTFDADGNEIEELEQNWDGAQLVNDSRWRTEYTSEGKPLLLINENWDGSTWVADYRQTYTIEPGLDGSIIEIDEYWGGTVWVNESRSTAEFDSNGRIILQSDENWIGSAWINRDRTSFTYNSNGNMTSILSEEWSGTEWVNVQRYSYTFNSDGLRTLWLFEDWNGTNWVGSFRFVYNYDSNGNNTENLNEEWDGSQWISVSRVSFTYDSNSNMIMGVSEIWDNSNWQSSPGSIGFSIGDFSTVYLSYSFFAYSINVYYGSITDVETDKSLSAQFELSQNYPNPFNPSTTIEFSIPKESFVQLKVFNILGKEISTLAKEKYSAGSYKVNFDGGNLPSGLYIAQMKAGKFSKSYKMMLLK